MTTQSDPAVREIRSIAIEILRAHDGPMSITDLRYAIHARVPWPEEKIREVVFAMVSGGMLKLVSGQKVIPRC